MAKHIYINGIDRYIDLIKNSLSITQALTSQIDECNFKLKGEQPEKGDTVQIVDDEAGTLFAGIIDVVSLSETVGDVNIWDVKCQDFTYELDRKLVNEIYMNVTADAIVRDIVTKYTLGFTVNHVMTGAPVVEYYAAVYIKPSEVFKALADYCNWQFYVDYNKDIWFFDPMKLSQRAPIDIVPGANFSKLTYTIDTTNLRNRVYIRGGTYLSDVFVYEVKADGVTRVWNLPHKPHELKVYVAGVQKTVGVENIDLDETQFDFMMNFQEKYVRCSSITTTPTAGVTLRFEYRYDVDVITMVEDLDSQRALAEIQGNDGIYEHVIVDESLTSITAAEVLGNNDLLQNANPKVIVKFKSTVHGWYPGQIVNINLPDRKINNSFLITKVKIELKDGMFVYNIECGSKLLGIADYLKAIYSAQKNKQLAVTQNINKFNYVSDNATVSESITATSVSLPLKIETSFEDDIQVIAPVSANFARNSVAYRSDGQQVAANIPRYEGFFDELVETVIDDFNRTEIGSNWQVDRTDIVRWSIENGMLKSDAADANGYVNLIYIAKNVAGYNVIVEYDVLFTGTSSLWGGFNYCGVRVDVNPTRCGIANGSAYNETFVSGISISEWHHVEARIKIMPGSDDILELYVDGRFILTDTFRAPKTNPYISLRSTYYTTDGGDAKYDNFKIRLYKANASIMVEEGTTNIAHDPNTDNAWWNAAPTSGIIWGLSNDWSATEQALKVRSYSNSHHGHSFYLDIQRDVWFTLRARIKNVKNALHSQFYLALYNSAGTCIQTNYVPEILAQYNWTGHNTPDYTEAWITYRIPSGVYTDAVKYTVQLIGKGTSESEIYLKEIQLEQKPYKTTRHPYNSTRSPELLTIPTAGVLNPQEGTVEFIFSPTTPQASAPWGRGFDWGDGYSNPVTKDDFRLVWGTGAGLNKILLSVAQANVGMRDFSVTLSRNLVVGNHYYVAIRWRLPGYLSLTIYDFGNGEVVSSSANDVAIAPKMDSPSVKAMLGTNVNGREWVNWLFDDLRISSRARTDEEIAAAYQSGLPLPIDKDTTAKLEFDGNLLVARGFGGEYQSIGSMIKVIPLANTIVGDLQYCDSADGVTWSDWQPIDVFKAYKVKYPGYFRIQGKAFGNGKVKVINFKAPDETVVLCGFAEVS